MCVAGYVIKEEKENDGEEKKGRDDAWHMSIGFNAGHEKENTGVYMCELENEEWKSPRQEAKENKGNMTSL